MLWKKAVQGISEFLSGCYQTPGSGRFKVKGSVTLPPDPRVYSACLTVRDLDSRYRNFFSKNGVYGNYCGTGWREAPSGNWQSNPLEHTIVEEIPKLMTPKDVLDQGCRRHDFCYDDHHKLYYKCDYRMHSDVCSITARNFGKNKMSETAGLLCRFWTMEIIPLATLLAPIDAAFDLRSRIKK